jgi:hypothetical protein
VGGEPSLGPRQQKPTGLTDRHARDEKLARVDLSYTQYLVLR